MFFAQAPRGLSGSTPEESLKAGGRGWSSGLPTRASEPGSNGLLGSGPKPRFVRNRRKAGQKSVKRSEGREARPEGETLSFRTANSFASGHLGRFRQDWTAPVLPMTDVGHEGCSLKVSRSSLRRGGKFELATIPLANSRDPHARQCRGSACRRSHAQASHDSGDPATQLLGP